MANASEAELVDIAAILGLHTLMDNEQYYSSLDNADGIANTVGFSAATKCKLPTSEEMEKPNTTDVQQTIIGLRSNDKDLVDVNLNNIPKLSISTLCEVGEALSNNTVCESISLVGTRTNDTIAKSFAEALTGNRTLKSLNMESNFLTIKGVTSIISALNDSPDSALKELRIDNQKASLGPGGEQNVADLIALNKNLTRFSYQFKFPGPRMKADQAISGNIDVARQKRMKK